MLGIHLIYALYIIHSESKKTVDFLYAHYNALIIMRCDSKNTFYLHFMSLTLWNSLPHNVRFCESLTTFRKHLNAFFNQHSSAPPSDPLPQCLRLSFWILEPYKFIYLLGYLLINEPVSSISCVNRTRLFRGCWPTAFQLVLGKRTSVEQFKWLLKTYLFGCWDHGALRLFV